MSEKDLRHHLANLSLGQIRYHPSIGSTNDEALAWASDGAPDFSLIVADEQTTGRGRQGRSWFSPSGAALAFSLILRPTPAERETIELFSGLGALALADALREIGLQPQIKWPNDVLLKRKKVSGILVESVWLGNEIESIVLGIGINIQPGAIPPDEKLHFPATCVEAETGQPVERFDLLRRLLLAIQNWRPHLGEKHFIQSWQDGLAFRGERVQVWAGDASPATGQIVGLEPNGNLRLALDSGELRSFRFGEVHLRPV